MRRLYNAVCEWLEASAEDMRRDQPDHPEGDNTTQLEYAHSYTSPPEMHAGQRYRTIDDDDSGAYRTSQPISLKWTGKQL